MGKIKIRELINSDLKPALSLIQEVFDEFEASEYSEEGIKTFYEFIEYDAICKKLENGGMKLWGAFDGEIITGVIANRDICHIALFFVDKQYHRQGIGRQLFDVFKNYVQDCDKTEITVNSSPYAVPVYRKLGFSDTDAEQLKDGLRYTPMVYKINDDNKETHKYMTMGLSLGICFGAAFGILFDNIAIGIPIGMCFGLGIGSMADYHKNKEK